MLQLPPATLVLQFWVPSVTVTVPVGVPLPGAVAVTVNVKLTGWPSVDGFGVCPVMAVVVAAAFTVWLLPADAPVAKFALPSEGATGVFAPPVLGGGGEHPAGH